MSISSSIHPVSLRWVLVTTLLGSMLCSLVPSTACAASDCFSDDGCAALVAKAKKAHNEKRYADALRMYQNAYDKVPDARLLVLRGRSYFKQGQPDRALDLYRAALPQLQSDAEHHDVELFIHQAEEAMREKGTSSTSPQTAMPSHLLPTASSQSHDTSSATVGLIGTDHQDAKASGGPVYKKWWFWTIIGVTAAGIATGVGLGIATREPDITGLMEYRP